jgi:uncharacterized protein (DUF362 family)
MPSSVMRPDVVFVSAAKLKTHGAAGMTLSLKNLLGLPPHDRSVPQTIVDLNCLRPVDFAVI